MDQGPVIPKQRTMRSILYVNLSLGQGVKIFPIGVASLASHVHAKFPEIQQRVLDISATPLHQRWQTFKKMLVSMQPDIVAFSWRQVRYFGGNLNDSESSSILYGNAQNPLTALLKNFKRWKHYVYFIRENIAYITYACRVCSGSCIVVGGAGFGIFYKDLLKKLPEQVIGVIGEGELFFDSLISKRELTGDIVFKKNNIQHRLHRNNALSKDLDMAREHVPTDYRYIAKIFPEFAFYSGETIGVETNRGCSQSCIYCPETAAGRKTVSFRKPADVIDEILMVQGMFNTQKIWFVDRLVVSQRSLENFKKIIEELIQRSIAIKWYGYLRPDVFTRELAASIVKSGLDNFIIPITSGSQKIVDKLELGINISSVIEGCKLLKEAGYHGSVDVEFTLGILRESADDIRDTVRVYQQIKEIFNTESVKPTLNICSLLPESKLERLLKQQAYLADNYNTVSFNPWVIKKYAYIDPGFRKIMSDAYAFAYSRNHGDTSKREERVFDYFLQNTRQATQ